jgi:hypothetical protein
MRVRRGRNEVLVVEAMGCHAMHEDDVARLSIQRHGCGLIDLLRNTPLKVTLVGMVQTRVQVAFWNYLKTPVGSVGIIQIKQD